MLRHRSRFPSMRSRSTTSSEPSQTNSASDMSFCLSLRSYNPSTSYKVKNRKKKPSDFDDPIEGSLKSRMGNVQLNNLNSALSKTVPHEYLEQMESIVSQFTSASSSLSSPKKTLKSDTKKSNKKNTKTEIFSLSRSENDDSIDFSEIELEGSECDNYFGIPDWREDPENMTNEEIAEMNAKLYTALKIQQSKNQIIKDNIHLIKTAIPKMEVDRQFMVLTLMNEEVPINN